MDMFKKYTFTDIAAFLGDLADFAAANGWGVQKQPGTRVSISKGDARYRVDYSSASAVKLYASPDGGATYNSAAPSIDYLINGASYAFVSCGTTIYIGRVYPSTGWFSGGLITVVHKVGAWSGGQLVHGTSMNSHYFLNGTAFYSASMFVNGAWSTMGSLREGSVQGSIDRDLVLANKQPSLYNAGILPMPVTIFVCNASTAYLHPAGRAPGLFRINAGDVYTSGEILPFGEDSYLVMPSAVSDTGTRDLFFKLSI